MIRSFRHKPLKQLWEAGRSGKIAADLQTGVLRRLDTLDASVNPNGGVDAVEVDLEQYH